MYRQGLSVRSAKTDPSHCFAFYSDNQGIVKKDRQHTLGNLGLWAAESDLIIGSRMGTLILSCRIPNAHRYIGGGSS
jgi:hypothetical protein